jgi:cytidylate kinase
MPTRIVTISHASGAGGDSIGRKVAGRLGFRYIDEEIIALAAEKEGLDPGLVADAERRKGLLERIIADFSRTQLAAADGVGGFWHPGAVGLGTRDELRELIVDAIRETAKRGDVVIVAHAASIPLAGRDDLLRVLITASVETRVQRVTDGTRGDAAEAAKIVEQSDKGRADYFRRFYGIDRELPTHYDLVVNTDILNLEDAVDIVVSAARRRA